MNQPIDAPKTEGDAGTKATQDTGPGVTHASRPRRVKPAENPTRPGKKTRPVKLVIDADQYEKLMLTSLRRGVTMSAIVNSLINSNLGTIVMYEKPPTGKASA